MLDDLLKTLAARGIESIGGERAPRSVLTEHRIVASRTDSMVGQGTVMPAEIVESSQASIPETTSVVPSQSRVVVPPVEKRPQPSPTNEDIFSFEQVQIPSVRSRDASLSFSDYSEYAGPVGNDPRSVSANTVSEGIVRIIAVEGPVIAKRAYDIYLRGCGIKRMGNELKATMNKALTDAIRQQHIVSENEVNKKGLLFSVVRTYGSPPIKLRARGSRSFEEIPPSELLVVARYLLDRYSFSSGSDEHLRAILECFDLKRLTTQVGTTLLEIIDKRFPYVDDFLSGMNK
jgi:hypothetical protein